MNPQVVAWIALGVAVLSALAAYFAHWTTSNRVNLLTTQFEQLDKGVNELVKAVDKQTSMLQSHAHGAPQFPPPLSQQQQQQLQLQNPQYSPQNMRGMLAARPTLPALPAIPQMAPMPAVPRMAITGGGGDPAVNLAALQSQIRTGSALQQAALSQQFPSQQLTQQPAAAADNVQAKLNELRSKMVSMQPQLAETVGQ